MYRQSTDKMSSAGTTAAGINADFDEEAGDRASYEERVYVVSGITATSYRIGIGAKGKWHTKSEVQSAFDGIRIFSSS